MTSPIRRPQWGCFLFLVSLAIPQPAFADAVDLPRWYVHHSHGVDHGWERVATRRLPGYRIEYSIESRLLIDVLGSGQEITRTATYVVDRNLTPVSVNVRTRRRSGEVALTGKASAGALHLRRVSGEVERASTLDLQQTLLFRATLAEYLSRVDEKGQKGHPESPLELSLFVIDEEALTAERARCRLEKTDEAGTSQWLVEIGDVDLLERSRIVLKNGDREREFSDTPPYSTRRSTKTEAPRIAPLRLTGRNVLMLDVDRSIHRPDRIASMTVRLTWEGVPFDEFEFEDGRQSLVSHNQVGTKHEVVVRIASPDEAREAQPRPRGLDAKRLLGPSRFIDPGHPEIAATAREWTRGTASARAAVKALARKIFEIMEGGDLIAETLSGPEVLQCRKGKCSEFSTLFASLARSLNLPTRIVLGERMIDAHWVGHMWNEVFIENDPVGGSDNGGEAESNSLGRWVTVDSTTGEVGMVPTLLKLTHSPSVSGTTTVRWGVTDSLDISITDIALTATDEEPDPGWKTGIAGNRYTNGDYGFRVSAPNERWTLIPKQNAGHVVIQFKPPEDDGAWIHCTAARLPVPLSARAMVGIRSARFLATYKDYKVEERDEVTIDGRRWQILRFTRAMRPAGVERFPDSKLMKTTEFVFHRGNVSFLVNLIAGDIIHDRHMDVLRAIVGSIALRPTRN